MSGWVDHTLGRVQRLQRARRISATFGGVYLGWKAHRLLAERVAPRDMADRWDRFHRGSARRVYRTAVDLRGLILKGCQFLGTRADLLPREWIEELSQLQDRVPPRPFPLIRRCVERELGRGLESLFERFEPEPLASASLAQVHAAVLRDGRRVAVKVQYPEIEARVRGDLANLRMLGRAIGWIERDFDPLPLVDELAEHVPRELDFLCEARNAEYMARLLQHRADVRIPRIHRRLSTRRVLVMEHLEGIKVTDIEGLEGAGPPPRRVVQLLVDVYLEQILGHGIFHADPHPGNLWIDPEGPRLILLDFGLVKRLPRSFRRDLLAALLALGSGRPKPLAQALARLGFRTRDGSPEGLERLAALILPLLPRGAERRPTLEDWVRIGDSLAEQLRANPIVRIPSHLVLLARCTGLLSGVSRSLGVRIEPAELARAVARGSVGRAATG